MLCGIHWPPWIGDAKQLMIVPDGALSLVNFASLPTDDGEYLAETALFHYLSSERELLQTQGAAEGVGLLAVGGVDFGATSHPRAEKGRGIPRNEIRVCRLQSSRV